MSSVERAAVLAVMLLPALALAQPGSETERKRREIERQLQLPKGKPPAPAPVPPPEVAEPSPAPPAAPAAPAAPVAPAAPPPVLFAPEIHQLLVTGCKNCHVAGGPAGASRLLLQGKPRPDYDNVRQFVELRRPRESLLVTKGAGQMHGGGPIAPAGSRVQRRLLAWIAAGALFEAPAAGAASPAPAAPRVARPRAPRAPVEVAPAPPVPPPPPAVAIPAPAPSAPPVATPAAPEPGFAAAQGVLTIACRACHNPQGMAAASRLHLSGEPGTDHPAAMPFVVAGRPAESSLLTKGEGIMHGGGVILAPGTEGHRVLQAWIAAGAPGPAAGAAPVAAAPDAPAAAAPPPAAPLPAPAAPPVSAHARGAAGLALPLGFRLNGRFDLNYERRGLGRDHGFGDGTNVLRSYHQFLFLSRSSEQDPIGLSVELIALTTWEAHFRHRFQGAPLVLLVRGGKILVPFGNEPLFHQAYGGLVGFDQKVLPAVWAQEGASAGLVCRCGGRASLSADLYLVRGHRLRQADGVLNLQNDFSPADDLKAGMGARLGAAVGPFTAYYSLYFNPLGFDRRLIMQAADLGLWRVEGIPVLDRLVLGVGALRADVSGGGSGLDYYHFASYWQARAYATRFLYLQYRQGLRTFNNRRGVILDETRLQPEDASTHTLGLVGRWRGLTAGLHYFLNLEKASEADDDFFRATVVYEF